MNSFDPPVPQAYGAVTSKLQYLIKKSYIKRISIGVYQRILDPPRESNEIPQLPTNNLNALQVGEAIIAKIQHLQTELSECKHDLNNSLRTTNNYKNAVGNSKKPLIHTTTAQHSMPKPWRSHNNHEDHLTDYNPRPNYIRHRDTRPVIYQGLSGLS